ncbi:LexA repressor [Acaryochloris thomasi RCC1774]|uniref:LexA repressor n=1 Tax=Acaryochloris thomasi RCC1774 TaxID=1764569 RepID=A0A2W1JLG9_9CYAN|nr:translesion error-prone DNA polymerase V autoproteolytic subunit [Acaryochloris thomasi]PZD71044.1 LexA repressor [Acaryochloris thomasi RCC1774]
MQVQSIHELKELSELERPLLGSLVPAGFPSPADQYIECNLDLNKLAIAHPSATFFMRVSGDSMVEAGIFDRDYLVVDRAVEATHGSIVIAELGGELTVKRLYKQGRVLELRPENSQYQPIRIHRESELEIWGVVRGVFRKTV